MLRLGLSRVVTGACFGARTLTPPISSQGRAHSVAAMAKPTIRGVVFDMDGTVTVPCIDFALMRSRCGVKEGQDILDAIKAYPPEQQTMAYNIIQEMEEEAKQKLQVMPGAHELCEMLDRAGVPRGLITRNVSSGVEHFHQHFRQLTGLAPFSPAISREDRFAYKPSPEALLHICEVWGVSPTEVVMCGDSAKDDIPCGNAAGAVTVLLDQDSRHHAPEALDGDKRPTYIVRSLQELHDLLQKDFQLAPPLKASILT